MRFSPFISTVLYTFSNLTRVRAPKFAAFPAQHPLVTRPLRASMPTIPFFGALFGSSSSSQDKMSYPDKRSDDEWRAVLNKDQFRILREKGTEPPHTGKYDKHYPSEGVYACAGCEAPLYKANHKFKSGCGWPAYFDSIPGAVVRHEDRTLGMLRTEIVCSNCGGHLGHVFKGEGYDTPTDERHCVNSVSLTFSPDEKVEGAGQNAAKESKA
ncbi:methionine-r-sulfoxide reductase [Colletotrichum truncatum]|uniref:Methionine-r-sulfoxide reductase n=1 Tax=Colletotrichum truncatum TaxID=5467 RepID=A0ACC3ZCJ7_COLTU|nr:methionine-r-sulfoxide reductase [Colletotrichum truncatum]KAF6797694.1 methionine-r-sulfoxide reductase [Colletotrichum truncatum]